MTEQLFDIIFRGDIVFGQQLVDVKLRMQQLFKADAAKVDALFSGRPVPLKRGLDLASAQKYKDVLLKAGAQVDVVSSGQAKSAVAPQTQQIATPLTLAQRLAQQEAAAKIQTEIAALREATKCEQAVVQSPQDLTADRGPSWTLAPVGEELLRAVEKKAENYREINISAISVRPEGGNILDASEQAPAPVASVVVPDFGVAEVGADLIRVDEKVELPIVEVELEDWTLAASGENMIEENEKPSVQIPVIKIPEVGLAPPGADLGQLKPQITPIVPDISQIRLAD